jgi:hypothetical protein
MPPQVPITCEADTSSISPEEFVARTITGPARCRISILKIPVVVKQLVTEFQKQNIQSSDLIDLLDNSLLSVCPKCNHFSGGKSLLMIHTLSMANGTVFTGSSGGIERMAKGHCLIKSCDSTEHELFWYPDLT